MSNVMWSVGEMSKYVKIVILQPRGYHGLQVKGEFMPEHLSQNFVC